MIRRGHIVAIAVVLIAGAAILVRVAGDRRDPPEAALWLTERELPLLPPEQESTFLVLRLRIHQPEASARALLDAALLRDLGFDTRVPADDPSANRAYETQLARRGWVAVEYEGETWRAWQRREREKPPEAPAPGSPAPAGGSLDARLEGASRLFLLAAGADPRELRRRYADREHVLVLPVQVRPHLTYAQREKPCLTAQIFWEATEVAVPARLRAPLAGLSGVPLETTFNAAAPLSPRYRVRLLIGRRFLPRVDAIESLAASVR